MPRYDAIIIGGGHNGLVTAAYLARAGRKVLVLERRELVGGCAVTEEIWPGYRVSTAAYLTSLLQERIVRELELERFGYQVDAKDPAFFSVFPDGRHFFMWQDRAKTLAEIAKFSRRDAEVYPGLRRPARADLAGGGRAAAHHAAAVPSRRARLDLVEYLKLAGPDARPQPQGYGRAGQDLHPERRRVSGRVVRIATEVKVTLATDGVIGANGGPRSPGTAYILLHHCMGGVAGHRGLWGFVRGGMGAVSEAIAASARAKGAEIRTGAPVARVLVRDGRAYGVALESGEEIEALDDRLESRSQDHVPAAGRGARISTRISSPPSAASASKARAARSTWRSTACRSSRPIPERPGRTTAPPCTSARTSSTWSAPGTTPSTAGLPSARCSN